MIHPTLARLRARRAAEDRGFTLIELLVVVVIIGILVGIAVPLYLNYRKGAQNKAAESDVRNGISTVEQYYNDNSQKYPATLADAKLQASTGDTMGYAINSVGDGYVLCAKNDSSGGIFFYDSTKGGSVKQEATTVTWDPACANMS